MEVVHARCAGGTSRRPTRRCAFGLPEVPQEVVGVGDHVVGHIIGDLAAWACSCSLVTRTAKSSA